MDRGCMKPGRPSSPRRPDDDVDERGVVRRDEKKGGGEDDDASAEVDGRGVPLGRGA